MHLFEEIVSGKKGFEGKNSVKYFYCIYRLENTLSF